MWFANRILIAFISYNDYYLSIILSPKSGSFILMKLNVKKEKQNIKSTSYHVKIRIVKSFSFPI